MKMKIKIIYGLTKEFNSKFPTKDTISLSEMVRWSDARRSNPIEDELIGTYRYLTVTTEESGGVTDAFISPDIIKGKLIDRIYSEEINKYPEEIEIISRIKILDFLKQHVSGK